MEACCDFAICGFRAPYKNHDEATWLSLVIAAILDTLNHQSLSLHCLVAIASLAFLVSEHACHGLTGAPSCYCSPATLVAGIYLFDILCALLPTYVVFIHINCPEFLVEDTSGSAEAVRQDALPPQPHRARPGFLSAQSPQSTLPRLAQSDKSHITMHPAIKAGNVAVITGAGEASRFLDCLSYLPPTPGTTC